MKVYLNCLKAGFKHWKGDLNASYRGINLRKNYYKSLNVEETASMLTIKKAYLKLVKELHPDVNPKGHAQFTEIQEAYNILSNS